MRSFLLVLSVFFVVGCQRSVLTTEEGILRKVFVRQDDTSIYSSPQMSQQIDTVDQWDILFIVDEGHEYYGVTKESQNISDESWSGYVHEEDVFEWNSRLVLSYTNSPHESGREPVKTFQTLSEAQRGEGQAVMIEKPEHRAGDGNESGNVHPILSEPDNDVYLVASLYDNIDEEGAYVFLGNYGFGYVRYTPEAHEFRRYVSRQQLTRQMLSVVEGQGYVRNNMRPSDVESVYGLISDLLAEWGPNLSRGTAELERAFRGSSLPEKAQEGIFDLRDGVAFDQIDPELTRVYDQMREYQANPNIWNRDGYSFVPAEWME